MMTSQPPTRTRTQPPVADAPIPASSQLNELLGAAAKTIGASANGPADATPLGTRGGCSRGPCIARAGDGAASATPMAAITRGLRTMAARLSPRTEASLRRFRRSHNGDLDQICDVGWRPAHQRRIRLNSQERITRRPYAFPLA